MIHSRGGTATLRLLSSVVFALIIRQVTADSLCLAQIDALPAVTFLYYERSALFYFSGYRRRYLSMISSKFFNVSDHTGTACVLL